MSNLNPNAPSFPVSNYQPNTAHSNKQGYNNGGGPGGGSSGGSLPNERYGGSMMYDHNNYHQGGGGGGGSGGGGGGSGGGGGYGQGGGYMGNGPHGYSFGHRMGRNNRQPHVPHSHYQNINGMVGGGSGGAGGMRGNYMGVPAPYQQIGGMDMNGGYDQPPPQQQMAMQSRMQNMPHRPISMNNNMMGGGGRMSYNNNQRTPMVNIHATVNSQSNLGLGSVSAHPPPPIPAPAPVPRPLPVPPPAAAPSVLTKHTPRAVMVVGYKKTGKTSVAKAIAETEGFEYLCLKSPHQQEAAQTASTENEEEAEEENVHPLERLAPLRAMLEKKSTIKGIVIDDAFSTNKYHAHYVVHYLVKAGLQLDVVVALVPDLASLVGRGVSFAKSNAKVMHPEAFEFASSLDPERVIVVDEDLKLNELTEKAAAEVSALLEKNDAAIKLEQECFIPSCPMVTDAEEVEKIIEAERSVVKRPLPYTFTYSEPNYLLDYVQFAQSAAKLQHYLVTPWIWGDKLSLIGYDTSVYVHLTSYNLVFKMNDVPSVIQELMKRLKSEVEASGAEDSASQVLFCVEASMLADVIYISDMMIIGKHYGAEMLVHDRVKLLGDSFGNLPSSSSVRLLEHYPVCDIKTCLNAYKDVSRGVIFVNPDGIAYGRYDVRNFVYPSENKKTVRVRIWAGSITDGMWSFEAYVREYEDEVLATSRTTGANSLPVMICDSNVDAQMINDGNIIECVMEKTATKGKSREKNAVLTFCRRCKWEVTPITQFYMWAFADPPRWSTESFLDACSTIASVRPTV
ncbi:hypothetical protein JKF63_02499 [Porcisia hertigi]|uniref:Uncharacterized protein n=1 Tax=Porcisia hertigi TaxID=2761500 RepID=A0A836IJU8_9TRYP|nr:hypothetical protein JKF63_02499 [Porcisia hertigi]